MTIGKSIGRSILYGWLVAGFLLLIAFGVGSKKIAAILLWNVVLFMKLAGNGPLLGYDAQGNPMYEGTPVHLFFGLLGIVSSFLIYPVIVFLILRITDKFSSRRKLI